MSVRRLDPVQPESFAFSSGEYGLGEKDHRQLSRRQAGLGGDCTCSGAPRSRMPAGSPKPAMEYIGQMLDMAFIRVYEVATFYTMFQLSPVGKKAHVQVCGTTPCMLRGAEDLKKVCQRKIHHDPHHLSADGNFSWEEVECLGACVNAPMVQIWKDTYEDLTPAEF